MTTDNIKVDTLALWDKVEKTDPGQTRPITGKPYKGTSPRPHYLVWRATEAFGPCGIGWGFRILDERIEDGAGHDRVHIAHVQVWYNWQGEHGEVEHVGETMFSGTRRDGSLYTDEDAPKKSVTDALIKALSMIGFAGDVFMGRFDDSKYVSDLREEFRQSPALDVDGGRTAPKPSALRETISEIQREELAKLVEDGKADLKRFLLVMGVESLADISASQYQRAKDLLQQKVNLIKQVEEAKKKTQAGNARGKSLEARHAE